MPTLFHSYRNNLWCSVSLEPEAEAENFARHYDTIYVCVCTPVTHGLTCATLPSTQPGFEGQG